MFRCAKCNEVQEPKVSAMIYYFKDKQEKSEFQKLMKPITRFSKSGKFVIKEENAQKGKGNVSLCSSCWGSMIK